MNIGFLASHNGSNMQAIIDSCKNGELQASPVVVISNNGDSGALRRAEKEGIANYHISGKTHPDTDEMDKHILEVLEKHQVDIVVLAGYMKKIGLPVLRRYKNRILNIHPALLPEFGGQGMYGMNVHRAVIESGKKESGATVHIVDEQYDSGPILAQAKVEVGEDDTPESLAKKVLQQEHEIFSKTLQDIATGVIKL